MPRSVVSIDDLTSDEMEAVFQLADRFLAEMATPDRPYRVQGIAKIANQSILATLFFEASTRTRLSFESAMLRLGGQCISASDPSQTSASKGETIADMVRVVGNYADAIVIRHPLEGAARVAAEYAAVPVINAGDGSHEHPTQTLCDLYTLRAAQAEKGRPRSIHSIKDLNVVVWGDLRHGRTVHSLVYALARLKARIIPRAAPGCELPEHVGSRLKRDYHCIPLTKENVDDGLPPDVDVVYMTPEEPHQLALFDIRMQTQLKGLKTVDALYSTRLQLERLATNYAGEYPAVDSEFLKQKRYREANVMHPLPRVDELSYDIDEDKRSMYFKQAAYGVPVRMALIASLLELHPALAASPVAATGRYPEYRRAGGIECTNDRCVSRAANERRYLAPRFWIVQSGPPILRCVYCDVEQQPGAYGAVPTNKFVADLATWQEVNSEDLIFFAGAAEAAKAGYEPRKRKPRKKDVGGELVAK
jgi:aspartate carbamoyltransferase catalytic subunit